jgi:hypothetical protein
MLEMSCCKRIGNEMHMELRYSVKRCDEKHVKLSSMFSEVEIGYNKNRCIEKHVKL